MPACAGVTVIVDSHPGVRSVCDAHGAGVDALTLLSRNGWHVTDVATEPGFVCRIDGQPATSCAQTPPESAYWSLWWSDGTGADWTYASLGAGSLTVPAGGSVAFSWDDRPGDVRPSVPPRTASTATTAQPAHTTSGSGDLPGWVAPVVVAAVLLAALLVAIVRRRRA